MGKKGIRRRQKESSGLNGIGSTGARTGTTDSSLTGSWSTILRASRVATSQSSLNGSYNLNLDDFEFEADELYAKTIKRRSSRSSSSSSNNNNNKNNETIPKRFASKALAFLGRLLLILLTLFCHGFSLFVIIYGFLVRHEFHTGEECDMTYMVPRYLPIHVPTHLMEHTPTPYKLYKYIDGRDPRRHQRLLTSKEPVTRGYCSAKPHVVVFVPGHWGSYGQCRSLGAHGVGWTRKREPDIDLRRVGSSLLTGEYNGETDDIDKFVFDVFCVDFVGQGGALHGAFLRAQGEYLDAVVRQLAKDCHVSEVTLVGHSVGGLVTRAVPAFYYDTEKLVKNIVTLATPHVDLPYTFDRSLRQFYTDLDAYHDEYLEDVVLISISGSLRDEIIEPHVVGATYAGALSIHGALIMGPRADGIWPGYGMDHKAIVWCRQLNVEVRTIIFMLNQLTKEGKDTFDRLTGLHDRALARSWHNNSMHTEPKPFNNNVWNIDTNYEREYLKDIELAQHDSMIDRGVLKLIAMESVLPYNAECILALYASVCGLHYSFTRHFMRNYFFSTCILLFIGWLASHESLVPVTSTLLLAFVVNALYLALRWVVACITRLIPQRWLSTSWPLWFTVVFLVARGAMITRLVAKGVIGEVWPPLGTDLIIEMNILIMMLALSSVLSERRLGGTESTFGLIVIVVWPFLVAGKIVLIKWCYVQKFDEIEFEDFGWFALRIAAPVLVRLLLSHYIVLGKPTIREGPVDFLFSFLSSLIVLGFIYPLLGLGNGHRLGNYISCLATCDIFKFVVRRLRKRPKFRIR